MKFGLTGKFFAAFMASCLLVMVGTLFALHENFRHGFLNYVRSSNETRVETVAGAMGRIYAEHGSWDFLKRSAAPNETWFLILRSIGQIGEPESSQAKKPLPPVTPLPPPPPPIGLRTHLWLLDMNHEVLAGFDQPPADAFIKPIVAGGHTVGWVASTSPTSLTRQADLRFVDQQVKTAWRIACMAAVVAAMMAVLLSRSLLAPLRRLASTTHQLAAGNFHVRVPVNSKDEMGQLAEDFNRLAHALGSNEQMRRNFIADVSHELRTPLAVLRGELEALEDGVRALTPASLRSLQSEVTTLSKLVDDLHQLSLADVGALAYRKFEIELGDVVDLALGAFRERLAEKQIVLSSSLTSGCTVFGDPDRLGQLLNNLLENSIRYTDANGHLEVSCRSDGDRVVLDFQDSAPGVPASEIPFLFDRFRRMESSRNRASGGSGLGLAICKSIVEAHEGTIVAQASPLGGLRLSISLPRVAS